jgi:hypothetical protein
MAFATYKIHPRNISFEKSDLKRLADFITQKTNETKEAHTHDLNFEGQTADQRTDTLRTLDEAYKIAVFVYGAEGEELLVHDASIFDAPEFPEKLTRLTIDTFIPFRNRTNFAPRNGIRVDLDFSSSKILDWQSNLSGPTPNLSEALIQGIDENWRAAAIAHLQRLFQGRKNYRGFLHAAFTYDKYLWLLFMPLYFYGLIILEPKIDQFFGPTSAFLKAAIYVYSFFVFVNLYRVFIGYIRWTFQSIELKGARSTQQKHRRFLAFLATAIIIPIAIALLTGK